MRCGLQMPDALLEQEVAGMQVEQGLLAQTVDTIALLVDAPVALGFTVDEHQTVDRVIVHCAQPDDELKAAPLLERLPRLEPIDPFSPRRAHAAGAAVMAAADAGGDEHVARSMFGRHLRKYGYATPVVLYFRRDERIECGITLLRPVDAPPFDARAVQVLRDLHSFLEHAVTRPGRRSPAPSEPVAAPEPLTTREAQVAALVADGCSNAAVALALGMSEATVKTHLTHVYAKLGVRTRTQLAVLLPRNVEADPAPVAVAVA
jgi:DNA-binding CsgD family transcriptional regulator